MKNLIVFLVVALLAINSRAQRTVINDANAELRPVKGFHGIDVSSSINLYLSHGDEETVAVSASDVKWRDRIRTEIKDGILKIWLEGKAMNWGNHKLRAYVSFTTLNKLTASGASDVFVDGVIAAEKLTINLSGSSDFKGAVQVGELWLDQSGASDAQITGIVSGATKIETSGASDVKGYDLVTQTCDAHASGASDVRITVTKELNADASGASSIYYKGDGVIGKQRSSGASSVGKKG